MTDDRHGVNVTVIALPTLIKQRMCTIDFVAF